MPSPFPGMNPYLEQAGVWPDFHNAFMIGAREVLAAQTDPKYIVRVDAHVYLHELPGEHAVLIGRSDIGVSERRPEAPAPTSATAVAAPAQVVLPVATVDEERIRFLEIRGRERRELVTVIEMLSPANKYSGPDREQFIAKRQRLLSSDINYVELDLLRGGPRMPIVDLPDCDYYALARRGEDRPRAGFWPIRLRERLPEITIPLRAPDPDVLLDLQAVLHRVYDAARYGSYIYDGTPEPALSPEDAEWARQFLPAGR